MMVRAAPIRGFRIVRRDAGRWFWLRTFLLAAIGSILVTALLFAIAGADVLSGFEALIVGSVGSKRALVETLTRATPLILTGVGTVAVAEALLKSEPLVAEAGTGVGKSLAYLVPAVVRALVTGERVTITTATRTLQDQLVRDPGSGYVFPWRTFGRSPGGHLRLGITVS